MAQNEWSAFIDGVWAALLAVFVIYLLIDEFRR